MAWDGQTLGYHDASNIHACMKLPSAPGNGNGLHHNAPRELWDLCFFDHDSTQVELQSQDHYHHLHLHLVAEARLLCLLVKAAFQMNGDPGQMRGLRNRDVACSACSDWMEMEEMPIADWFAASQAAEASENPAKADSSTSESTESDSDGYIISDLQFDPSSAVHLDSSSVNHTDLADLSSAEDPGHSMSKHGSSDDHIGSSSSGGGNDSSTHDTAQGPTPADASASFDADSHSNDSLAHGKGHDSAVGLVHATPVPATASNGVRPHSIGNDSSAHSSIADSAAPEDSSSASNGSSSITPLAHGAGHDSSAQHPYEHVSPQSSSNDSLAHGDVHGDSSLGKLPESQQEVSSMAIDDDISSSGDDLGISSSDDQAGISRSRNNLPLDALLDKYASEYGIPEDAVEHAEHDDAMLSDAKAALKKEVSGAGQPRPRMDPNLKGDPPFMRSSATKDSDEPAEAIQDTPSEGGLVQTAHADESSDESYNGAPDESATTGRHLLITGASSGSSTASGAVLPAAARAVDGKTEPAARVHAKLSSGKAIRVLKSMTDTVAAEAAGQIEGDLIAAGGGDWDQGPEYDLLRDRYDRRAHAQIRVSGHAKLEDRPRNDAMHERGVDSSPVTEQQDQLHVPGFEGDIWEILDDVIDMGPIDLDETIDRWRREAGAQGSATQHSTLGHAAGLQDAPVADSSLTSGDDDIFIRNNHPIAMENAEIEDLLQWHEAVTHARTSLPQPEHHPAQHPSHHLVGSLPRLHHDSSSSSSEPGGPIGTNDGSGSIHTSQADDAASEEAAASADIAAEHPSHGSIHPGGDYRKRAPSTGSGPLFGTGNTSSHEDAAQKPDALFGPARTMNPSRHDPEQGSNIQHPASHHPHAHGAEQAASPGQPQPLAAAPQPGDSHHGNASELPIYEKVPHGPHGNHLPHGSHGRFSHEMRHHPNTHQADRPGIDHSADGDAYMEVHHSASEHAAHSHSPQHIPEVQNAGADNADMKNAENLQQQAEQATRPQHPSRAHGDSNMELIGSNAGADALAVLDDEVETRFLDLFHEHEAASTDAPSDQGFELGSRADESSRGAGPQQMNHRSLLAQGEAASGAETVADKFRQWMDLDAGGAPPALPKAVKMRGPGQVESVPQGMPPRSHGFSTACRKSGPC